MRSHHAYATTIYILFVIVGVIFYIQSSDAVREGTSNANIIIKRYEREGDFARAALWCKTAANCLDIISIPMTEILIRYYVGYGKDKLASRGHEELADVEVQRRYHLQQAKANWEKSEAVGVKHALIQLDTEREKITQFIGTWVAHYPDKFYDFGIYPNLFKPWREVLKRKGDYATVLNVEADAAEVCANQYNEVTIAYFRREAKRAADADGGTVAEGYRQRAVPYEKVRNMHRRRAVLLRVLAQGKPKAWPPEADKREINLPENAINVRAGHPHC